MKRVIRLVVGALIAAMCLTGATALNSSSANASAQTTCSGVRIGYQKMRTYYTKVAVAELVVYYNAATGKNCAVVNHIGATYGKSLHTEVYISKCPATTRKPNQKECHSYKDSIDVDGGWFEYYAGPVKVYAPRNCVWANGNMWLTDGYVSASMVVGCPIG